MWGATRAIISATAVMIAALVFGLVNSPFALFAIPAAYLIGVVFASMAMTVTATATTIGAMNNFFTLFLLPMFYLSGTFFPLERLPDVVRQIAWILPLTPAAALTRGLMTGELTPLDARVDGGTARLRHTPPVPRVLLLAPPPNEVGEPFTIPPFCMRPILVEPPPPIRSR